MPSSSSLIAIVGPSGAGKSTICSRVALEAARRGLPAGGVMASARLRDGVIDGLDAINVATGERLPLAEYDRPTDGPSVGHWHFHPDTIAAGLGWCSAIEPGALVVVDEMGPLELVQGSGWAPLLPSLASHPGPVLVAVRPSLADTLLHAVGGRAVTRIDVAEDTRDAAATAVLAALGLGG